MQPMMLIQLTCLLVMMACAPVRHTSQSATLPVQRNEALSVRAMENEIFHLVNRYRRSKGLSSLESGEALRKEAEGHSLNMARGKIPLSHNGFDTRIERIRRATGVKGRSGENVAEGYKTARQVVDAWIKSPGHRRHMLGDFDLTGVGVVRGRNGKLYFTQIFIARQYRQ